jgi:hypothetical protein
LALGGRRSIKTPNNQPRVGGSGRGDVIAEVGGGGGARGGRPRPIVWGGKCVGEHSHSKARHVSQSTVGTPQNEPVHFGSKVRRSVETAQNVPVHFGSKGETVQNVPVHFGSQSPVETTQKGTGTFWIKSETSH